MPKQSPRDWPSVELFDPVSPPIQTSPQEEPEVRVERTVVTQGVTLGIPWRIQAVIMRPRRQLDNLGRGSTVGMEFLLGSQGELGGGRVNITVLAGKDFTISGLFVGSHPEINSWVGAVSDRVSLLEARLDDGHVRPLTLHRGPEGFP